MITFLLIYFSIGLFISTVVTIWAAVHDEHPTPLDFVAITLLYPYYLFRLLTGY